MPKSVNEILCLNEFIDVRPRRRRRFEVNGVKLWLWCCVEVAQDDMIWLEREYWNKGEFNVMLLFGFVGAVQ